jgi:hypothetical protein
MSEQECEHDIPPRQEEWDDSKHGDLPTAEVKERFPHRQCSRCRTVIYDSLAHYVAGDW